MITVAGLLRTKHHVEFNEIQINETSVDLLDKGTIVSTIDLRTRVQIGDTIILKDIVGLIHVTIDTTSAP